MEYISSSAVCLQSSRLAVVEANESVSTVIETLEAVSTSVDRYHDQWYEDAVKLADSVGVTPKMHRVCNTQIHRENIPSNTVSEYYRRPISIPILNEVITDLCHRFNPANMKFVGGFYCIPSLMEKNPQDRKKKIL